MQLPNSIDAVCGVEKDIDDRLVVDEFCLPLTFFFHWLNNDQCNGQTVRYDMMNPLADPPGFIHRVF